MSRRVCVGAATVLVAASVVAGCGAVEPAPVDAGQVPHRTAFETVSVRIELLPAPGPAARSDAGPRRETVRLGSQVEVVAPPGMAGRLHVRGTEVVSGPGTGVALRFRADDPGTFVVEAEETGLPLVVLEVLPDAGT